MKYVEQTQKRLLVKTIIYRIIGILITFIGGFLFTNDYKNALLVTLLIEFTQMLIYFIYEQLWNNIEWGINIKIV